MQRKEETAKERLSLGGEKQRQPERDMERGLESQETEIQRREPEKYRQPETEGQRKGQRDTKGCRNSRVKDTEVTSEGHRSHLLKALPARPVYSSRLSKAVLFPCRPRRSSCLLGVLFACSRPCPRFCKLHEGGLWFLGPLP